MFSATGMATTLLAGFILITQGEAGLGWWLVFIAVPGSAIVIAMALRGQRTVTRLSRKAASDSSVIEALHPVPVREGAPVIERGPHRRWTGAASVPGGMGYVEVGLFLAVAELGDRGLVLRVRPGVVRLMFAIENLTVHPADGAVIYPARALGRSGIEIRVGGRPSYYFWSDRRSELLAALAAAGFEVSAEEQRMRR